MFAVQVSVVDTTFYKMSNEERIKRMDEIAMEQEKTRNEPWLENQAAVTNFPSWLKDAILVVDGRFRRDEENDLYKRLVKTKDEADALGSKVTAKYDLESQADEERKQWRNTHHIAVRTIQVTAEVLGTDDELADDVPNL